jgi:lipopolysaccharide/colanic/teichoic acid biosynthesis glycosyltransferase
MKRLFDLFFLMIMFPLIVPIFVLAMLAIWCERSGPIFYASKRIGQGGKPFKMLKFRTMYSDGDARLSPKQKAQFAKTYKIENDPRITPVGRWLRLTSIDELPQIINVFRGEMHIVGPRPKLPEEIGLFGDHAEELLSIAPGITGYWQVHRTSAASDQSMRDMELHYVRTRNIVLDIAILLRTPWRMFFLGNE